MRTVVSDPQPAEFEALLERRREWGADVYDEVWDGVYRMNPVPGDVHWLIDDQLAALLRPLARAAGLVSSGVFNLGDKNDYRVPDRGMHLPETRGDWRATAALVLEILSPGQHGDEKLPFFAAHGVDEVVIVDPKNRSVRWLGLDHGAYRPLDRSRLIELAPDELAAQLDWP